MATQITTLTAGYILIQAGHGIPNHAAPKGSQFTDVDTATLYFNKNGLSDWEVNIDITNTGSTIGINTFSSFSSSTIGQGSVIATTSSDNLTFSGVNLSILVDNTNQILTLSAATPSDYTFTGGTVNGLTNFTNGLSATTISATTFYGNGANLTGISTQDTYLTGGTYNNGTATFTNNTGGTFTVTGFKTSDIFVTGGTYNNSNGITTFTNNTGGTFTVSGYFKPTDDIYTTGMTFNSSNYNLSITRNDGTSFTQNLAVLASDMTITGGTYNNNTGIATFTNNTGGTFSVSGFLTGMTDTYTTGFTYSNNVLTLKRNADQPDLSVMINSMTGLTVDGIISTTTISATTYQNLPTDIRVTGGTYSNGTTIFTNNTGGTFTVTGFKTSDLVVTGGTYNNGSILFTNNTGGTFNVSGLYTGYTAPIDVTVTGGTYNTSSGIATFTNNTGGTFTLTGFKTSDLVVTGGTYSNGTATFTNNTGGTFSVSGFKTDDIFVTGGTYNDGSILFTNNAGGTFNVNGLYTGYTAPIDITVTGGTYNNGTASFTNNTGGTFNVSGFKTDDLVVTGGTYNDSTGVTTFTNNTGGTFTVSGYYTGYTAPIDVTVTGGTYNTSSGIATFVNNTGGTFNVSGFKTDDIFVTGATYSNGVATFVNNTGGTFNVSGFKTDDLVVTGATYNNNNTFTFTNNTGGTFNVLFNTLSGVTVNGYTTLSGLTTVYGDTPVSAAINPGVNNSYDLGSPSFRWREIYTTNIDTSNAISSYTLYSSYNTTVGNDLTVSGNTLINGNLTANTVSATTYYNLPTDIRVTGATYSNNTFTYTNNTGGTFNVLANTMTGLTVNGLMKATTLSATSIDTVDYIIFNTGTTSATTVAGTVYFDNTEKALSYNTSINQGVTVNLGQQNYIRVFNNTGIDIPRGKALELLSSYSGLPSVSLAINKKNGSNIIGVSSEIIPNNKEGIAISYGIISNIELTGMTVGSLIYASDKTAGDLVDVNSYLSFPLTARTNQIGYVIQTGVTTGKLFVAVNNENTVLSLTDLERNVLEGNVLSSGVFQFNGMVLSTGNTFNVGSAQGWVIDNTTNYLTPVATYVNFSGTTGVTTPYLTSHTETFVYLTSGSNISLSPTFPTPQDRRLGIYLGKLGHANKTSIVNVFNEPDNEISPLSQFRDMFTPIKLINDGVIISPNGANLQINNSAGTLYGMGINFTNNVLNPNSLTISGSSPITFQYRTQTGGTSSNITSVIPSNYDVNGIVTPIGAPAKQATNQRIYLLQNGQFRLQYGQTVYADLTTAIASAQSEVFNIFPNFKSVGVLVGILSLRSDTTNLSDAAYSKITFVSKFGELLGGTGGVSTTTLQQAYDNSTNPEIVINATLDGLTIKNGTGNADNVTRLLEGETGTNVITSFIRADGYISGTTFQTNGFIANNIGVTATTVSATTYYNLPIDISVTGGTYSSGTATFTNNTGGTFTVTGFSTGGGSTFTGGTVNGATNFTNGLTANTISATTYYNLPKSTPYINNKYEITSATTVSNNFNTGIRISGSPITNSYVGVSINGLNVEVGDGVITSDCYFSSNGDSSGVRNFSGITVGDYFMWNTTISDYELDNTDKISFYYNILQ